MPRPLKDIAGQRFGSLTVLSRADGTHEARWLCRCDCGLERVYVGGKLRRGDARCKCERGKDRDGLPDQHPGLHSVWKNMKDRCAREGNPSYPRYGGRGITVCHAWRTSFAAFLSWALENGWRPGLQIDRINNDGNYEPSNCRFVTRSQNCRNYSRNRRITFRGQTKLLIEWSETLGVPARVLQNRIDKHGWSVERALSTPFRTVAEAARARFSERIAA